MIEQRQSDDINNVLNDYSKSKNDFGRVTTVIIPTQITPIIFILSAVISNNIILNQFDLYFQMDSCLNS